MFRHLRTWPARWAAAVTATMAAVGAGLFVAADPAYAVPFPLTEDFETDPASRWVVDGFPGQTAARVGNYSGAHSGSKLASLEAAHVPTSARIYRTITPDITTPVPVSCSLSLYGRRVPGVLPIESNATHVYLKIRSGGPTGPVLLTKAKFFQGTAWTQWNVGTMSYPFYTFTIDIAAYHGKVNIDDIAFSCVGFP